VDRPAGRSGGARPRNRGPLRWLEIPSLSDHACAGYATDAERARLVVDWIVAGLELGQRCLYIGEGPAESVPAELPAVLAVDVGVRTGAIVTEAMLDLYDLSKPVDPERRLGQYVAAIERAIADGHTGLRVIGNMTTIVAHHRRRREHLLWEQYVDRYMAEHPFAALCLYDRRCGRGVDAIACAHPLHGEGDPPFAVYGTGDRTSAIAGELDASVWEIAAEVFDTIPDGDEVLDLEDLDFIDGGAAAILCDVLVCRRAAGRPLRVVGATHAVCQVWDSCGFDPSLLAVA
jgi:anti-anti-sigma regulatory factor